MHDKKENKKENYLDWATIALLAIVILVLANNQAKLNNLSGMAGSGLEVAAGVKTAEASVIPTGIPKIYGSEMGISYDDVSAYDQQKADSTIRKLGSLDDATKLSQDEMKRYISIASKISCEYCCGADSIIFQNGEAACGCAHSYAMRGLAKYLITKHPNEFTDDEVLEELGKWKTLFFPGQIQAKAQILSQQGIELNYINLASNKYRGIESGAAGGGMVGGC